MHILRERLGERLAQILIERLSRLDGLDRQRWTGGLRHRLLCLGEAVQTLGHAGSNGALMIRLRRRRRRCRGRLMLRALISLVHR